MSYELKLDKVCDHKVSLERVYLDTDLRTLRLSKPLMSSKTLKIFVNSVEVTRLSNWGFSLLDDETSLGQGKRRKIVLDVS